ncbi:hypothetical protein IE53DRAFT_408769 [Violaceomyces palustris]|uniref:Uncharacterized protein n=1 Tax=Violaceomyces palustris TaxID=1673888 RepID=A0ACD0P5K8_9BASI|nr:hypothetical protein IE53DRAFT_408769 [Violaceomyces palustris]
MNLSCSPTPSTVSVASSSYSSSQSRSRSPSPTSFFEQSLFSLFSHNNPAHGDPGDKCTFKHRNLPARPKEGGSRTRAGTHVTEGDGLASDKSGKVGSERVDNSTVRSKTERKLRYKIPRNSGANTRLFAHHQWDAGLYLAEMIADQSSGGLGQECDRGRPREKFADVRGKYIVELGAGTGLPGLVASVMGARKTILTDYPDPLVIANLNSNLNLALCPPRSSSESDQDHPGDPYSEARSKVLVEGLAWGNRFDEERVKSHLEFGVKDGFDLVLAADVLWVSSSHPLLISSLRSLLGRRSDSRILLVAGFHTGVPAVTRFFRSLSSPARDRDSKDGQVEGEEGGAGEVSQDEDARAAREGRWNRILPDWESKFGGIWERDVEGNERPWSGGRIPRKADLDLEVVSLAEGSLKEEEEEMGDLSERSRWVVCAFLRWADL